MSKAWSTWYWDGLPLPVILEAGQLEDVAGQITNVFLLFALVAEAEQCTWDL